MGLRLQMKWQTISSLYNYKLTIYCSRYLVAKLNNDRSTSSARQTNGIPNIPVKTGCYFVKHFFARSTKNTVMAPADGINWDRTQSWWKVRHRNVRFSVLGTAASVVSSAVSVGAALLFISVYKQRATAENF